MRTPSLLIAIPLAVLVSACSRSAPDSRADATLNRELDLAVDQAAKTEPVVSPLELAGETKAKTRAAAPERRRASAAHRDPTTRAVRKSSPAPAPAPAQPQPEKAPVAAAPTPASAPVPVAAAPAPAPSPSKPDAPGPSNAPLPEPVHTGHGGGWFPEPTDMGVQRPGMPSGVGIGIPGGGVIVLRGGWSGIDPCDERHPHGGMGGIGGGIMGGGIGATRLPRVPGLPGRIHGGFPGGGGGGIFGRH